MTPSTLLQRPDGRRWDVVVIGAGPAGALAARALARRGRSVLLVDRTRFPRHKVCGGCLNQRAIAAMTAVGLGRHLHDLDAVPLRFLEVVARGRPARLPLPGGVAVSRYALDLALVRAAGEAGATVAEGWIAQPEAGDVSGWSVRLRARDEEARVQAGVCLIAGGLAAKPPAASGEASSVAIRPGSRIGAGTVFRSTTAIAGDGTIAMAVAGGGYVGITRVEGGRYVVAAAFDPDHVRAAGGLPGAAARILETAGYPAPPEIREAEWRGTPPLTRRVRPLAGHRFLVLGDAAGSLEPFTGEGMAWAMTAGLGAAALADAHLEEWGPGVARAWSNWHWRTLARQQRCCRTIAIGLRHPWLIDAGLAALRRLPGLANPVLHHLNAPLAQRELGRRA